jgi:CxxC-x17-CxxC domain-containing protein
MNNFNKGPKFSRPNHGAARPSFGGSRGPRSSGGRDDGPKEMFDAQCSKCGNRCEVPFRPNGKKPVFCRDCFVREDGGDSRDNRNSYVKKDFAPKRDFDRPKPAFAPRHEDNSMRDMTRELESLNLKLDKLVRLMESSMMKPVEKTPAPKDDGMTLAKAVTKATAKPAVKPKAAAKKTAKKSTKK